MRKKCFSVDTLMGSQEAKIDEVCLFFLTAMFSLKKTLYTQDWSERSGWGRHRSGWQKIKKERQNFGDRKKSENKFILYRKYKRNLRKKS